MKFLLRIIPFLTLIAQSCSREDETKLPALTKSADSSSGYQKLLREYNCTVLRTNITLDCDAEEKIESLPNAISFPPQIEYVDFKNNKISQLSKENFQAGKKLRVMYFANNQISSIASETFINIPNLETIDLSHNNLYKLESGLFNGLNRLMHVDLGYNRLVEVNPSIFAFERLSLRELRLNHNEIKEIHEETFNSLHDLDALDLEDNILTELPEQLFIYNERLRDLKLSMNRFSKVPNAALRGAKALSLLDLSSNRFKQISKEDFAFLTSVTKLRMSRIATLERINEFAFQDLGNLRELYMEYNRKLTNIHPKAFTNNATNERICELTEISLKGNMLSTLSGDLLKWEGINEIDLSENPWHCDCKLKWMAHIHFRINNVTEEVYQCKKPYKHFNQQVAALTEADFTCSFFENDAIIVGVILLVVLFITGFTTICIILVRINFFEKMAAIFCRSSPLLDRKTTGSSNNQYVRVDCSKGEVVEVDYGRTELKTLPGTAV